MCCCRRILYNQPDFAEGESLLETQCRRCGIHNVVFLPKFHCELNFIKQCWGRAKSIYRTYPPSSSKEDLENNTLRSLESIPLPMMRKFSTRSWRFLDAYDRGPWIEWEAGSMGSAEVQRSPSVAAEYNG